MVQTIKHTQYKTNLIQLDFKCNVINMMNLPGKADMPRTFEKPNDDRSSLKRRTKLKTVKLQFTII